MKYIIKTILLTFIKWYRTTDLNVNGYSSDDLITKFMLSNTYVNLIANQESQSETIDNQDELLMNLKSIKKVLMDEHHPELHGDLSCEILTINDIIKQCQSK